MTITVINGYAPVYPLTASDIVDGHAYESEAGSIYIGNSYDDTKAYSICGNAVVFKSGDNIRLREINLEIRVV